MATNRPARSAIAIGDEITWIEIHPNGDEVLVSGRAWAPARAVGPHAAWWMLTGEAKTVLVARACRRHLVGRAFYVRRRSISTGELEWRSLWSPKGGRYVDVGEWFTETDERSRFARTFTPPTHVTLARPDVAARTELTLFATLCEALGRGEDVDASVDAASVARVADAP